MKLRRGSWPWFLGLLTLVVAAPGCGAGASAEGLIEIASPATLVGQPQRACAVVVQPREPDFQPEADAVRAQLLSALGTSGLFLQVTDASGMPSPQGDVVLNVVVEELNRVSSSDRTWMGNAAGQARVVLSVTGTDAATSASLGAAAVAGLAYGGINGGTTDDASLEAVRQTVWFLSGNTTPRPPEG